MRLDKGLAIITLVFGALITSQTVAAQECQCAGAPIGKGFSGGDGKPLKWRFLPRTVTTNTTIICYFKQVQNSSAAEVRDVNSQVANFFRKIIAKQKSVESCAEIAGDLKQAPTNGPLQYGPSSDGYTQSSFNQMTDEAKAQPPVRRA